MWFIYTMMEAAPLPRRVPLNLHADRCLDLSLSSGTLPPLHSWQADQIDWEGVPDAEDFCQAVPQATLRNWLAEGKAQIVKRGKRCTVTLFHIGHKCWYLKHFHNPSISDRGKHWWHLSPAQREFSHARELWRRQIPAVRPIAWGERKAFGLPSESWFLSEAVSRSQTLEHYLADFIPKLSRWQQPLVRERLLESLGSYVARLHDAGVFPRDLHSENLLVQPPADASRLTTDLPKLYLVDLTSVELFSRLTWRESAEHLAIFGAAMIDRSSRRERAKFWKTYQESRRHWRVPNLPRTTRSIERRIGQWNVQTACERDVRALEKNRSFQRLEIGNARTLAVAGVDPQALELWWKQYTKHYQEGTCGDQYLRWTEQGAEHFDQKFLRIERFIEDESISRWSWKERSAEAMQSWFVLNGLKLRNLHAPQPLAIFLPHRRGEEAVLLSAVDRQPQGLSQLWRTDDEATLPFHPTPDKSIIMRDLGRLIGRMHRWGVRSEKLILSQFGWISKRNHCKLPRACVTDWQAFTFGKPMVLSDRIHQLQALMAEINSLQPLVNQELQASFLRNYLRQMDQPPWLWKRYQPLIFPAATIEVEKETEKLEEVVLCEV
ncbi:Hypothetical protein PBC10988_31350 [Planctomycetales bacterium 10988]|nr:Hypothetical protein PBC10988_31350 [Planctomycetales bacterium 10988]